MIPVSNITPAATRGTYDAAIIGGGLAGLALSIQLAKLGHSVILFEKETYPFHKVCGEYISLESWDFIETLGLSLSEMNLPLITQLIVTAPNGTQLRQALPLGGFGISRYKLDEALKNIALKSGVQVHENCKVTEVDFLTHENVSGLATTQSAAAHPPASTSPNYFLLHTTSGTFQSRVCCGTFGKKSNLDVHWKRAFTHQKPNKLTNYIGVKYHIKPRFTPIPQSFFDPETISLHNFENGYCGMSRVEDGTYCLCYLTNAQNLRASGNSIPKMEERILAKNPRLKFIFENSERLFESPLTISQVSFNPKTQVENHVLMIGDAAGMIPPLSGNGMSMALHGSKIAAGLVDGFLSDTLSRTQMEQAYTQQWSQFFGSRLRVGRGIQSLFGRSWVTNGFVGVMKRLPGLTRVLIKQTHGEGF